MGSDSGSPSVDVFSGKLRIDQGKNRMVVNDGTNDILLAGEDEDGDIVFKVAQDGYDVKTATDQQLAFSSQFNSFKILSSGSIAISKTSSSEGTSYDVTHNFGYVPCVVAYTDSAGGLFGGLSGQLPGNMLPAMHTITTVAAPGDGGYSMSYIDARLYATADTTKIRFRFDTPSAGSGINGVAAYSGSYTANVRYYLLAETAS